MHIISKIFHYSGLRSIWQKIAPPAKADMEQFDYKPPATFPIWVFGLYFALFGIAAQRYESNTSKLEIRVNSYLSMLSAAASSRQIHLRILALTKIGQTQNELIPKEPFLWPPYSSLVSLFGENATHYNTVLLCKDVIMGFKNELDGVDLSYSNLAGIDLSRANLDSTNLHGANLRNTLLTNANLGNVKGLDIKQICSVKSIFGVRGLAPKMIDEINSKCPAILEKPIVDYKNKP